MQPSDIEDAAMFLLHLRLHRDRVVALPHEFTPKTIDDAYAIQDAMHRFAGWPIGMVKVGCTSVVAQQALAIPHPIGGRVPADGIFESGSTVPRSFLGAEPRLECEIAFRIGAAGEIDAIAPAIELVDPRFHDTSRVPGLSLIADNSAASGAVLGTPVEVETVDVALLEIELFGGDERIAEGSASALVDGPVGSLEWALDHEATRDRAVAPGTWIITGTCTGLTPTEWGTDYRADFGRLGTVHFNLGAE